eukprot:scaffold24.g2980.t1
MRDALRMAYYTRSRAASEYRSAGVLPFALSGGQVLALLGAEPTRTGPDGKYQTYMYRDFGGRRESADVSVAATASRRARVRPREPLECAEETMGMLWCASVDEAGVAQAAAAMEQQLSDPQRAIRVVHALKRGQYHMFITQARSVPRPVAAGLAQRGWQRQGVSGNAVGISWTAFVAPLMFRMAREQNEATGAVPAAEKSAYAWVPLKALLECAADSRPRYVLDSPGAVCGGPGTPPPCNRGRRRFLLHPCFASSVREAQGCGLRELVAQAQSLPLPPPPPLPAAVAAAAAAAAEQARRLKPSGQQAATTAAAAEAQAANEEEEEADESWGCAIRMGVGWWLQQAELAGALEAAAAGGEAGASGLTPGFAAPLAPAAEPALVAAAMSAEALGKQQAAGPTGLVARVAAAAARWPGRVAPASVPVVVPPRTEAEPPTPSSSLASSLLESKLAAEAAATAEVVSTIEQNGKRRRRWRSRRKRQQELQARREQEQQAAEREKGWRRKVRSSGGGGSGDSVAASPRPPQPHVAGPARRPRLVL